MQRTRLTILLISTLLILLNGCSEPAAESTIGSARLSITLKNIGELAKSSAIELQSLFVEMSKGVNIIRDTIPLNGNSEVLVTQNYVDMSEGVWSLKVESRDQNAEMIHADSTQFSVVADQTVDVSLSLVSKYSMLIANFLGIAEDVYRCELLVDGSMVADSTFPAQTELEYNITLDYDYLTTGTDHTIEMDAYGEYEGVEYLFYTGDTTITVLAGLDTSYEIVLEWVGPFGALRGDLFIEVTIGATGSITMNGNFPLPGDIMQDTDGNLYRTVQIGEQVWMSENLKVTHYRDGTAITYVSNDNSWSALTTEAYCLYDVDAYGALYNGYAVADSRNIAPVGWHVPSDAEWKVLEMYLGMSQSDADGTGDRGTNEGSKLAGNPALWNDGSLENDSEFGNSGFIALPGGYRSDGFGSYSSPHISGRFWSTPESGEASAFCREMLYDRSTVNRESNNPKHGFAVRCVQD